MEMMPFSQEFIEIVSLRTEEEKVRTSILYAGLVNFIDDEESKSVAYFALISALVNHLRLDLLKDSDDFLFQVVFVIATDLINTTKNTGGLVNKNEFLKKMKEKLV